MDDELAQFIYVSMEINKRTKNLKDFTWEGYFTSQGVFQKSGMDLATSLRTFTSCHIAIQVYLKLTKGVLFGDTNFPIQISDEYRDLDWISVDMNSLESTIGAAKKFPIVAKIREVDSEKDIPIHSFLILGKLDNRRYICFGKSGYFDEFEISDLEQVYSELENADQKRGQRTNSHLELDIVINN